MYGRPLVEAGVEVLAFLTDVTRAGVHLAGPIPVDMLASMEGVS